MMLALLLVACGSAPSPVVAPPPPAAQPAPAGDLLRALDAPAEAFLQGIVTVEAGGVSLMPCDVAAASKLIDDTALLAPVVQEQGGSVYIEGMSATVGDDVHLTALHRALPGGAASALWVREYTVRLYLCDAGAMAAAPGADGGGLGDGCRLGRSRRLFAGGLDRFDRCLAGHRLVFLCRGLRQGTGRTQGQQDQHGCFLHGAPLHE
jgi:hypothetical protein